MLPTPTRSAAYAPQLFVRRFDTAPPAPERITPIRNARGMTKPDGGLWTARHDGHGSSDWVAFCRANAMAAPVATFVLVPDPDARILELDTATAVDDTLAAFARALTEFDDGPRLDWEALAATCDAVAMTGAALGHPALWGVDLDSTIWFRWSFTDR